MKFPRNGLAQILFAIPILALGLHGTAAMAADGNQTELETSKASVQLLAPVGYPESARLKCTSGVVTVDFTIGANGNATDISVVESTAPGVFDKVVIDSITNSRFKPRIVNGKANSSRYRLVYRFSPPPPQRAQAGLLQAIPLIRYKPTYPPEAQINHIEGTVLLGFTVGADGRPEDMNVLSMSSRARNLGLTRSAKAALSRSIFAPKCVNGEPQPFKTRYKYTFTLPHWVEY